MEHTPPERPALDLRPYDRERDFAAVVRIWREVGWIDEDDHEPPLERFLDAADVEVGLIDGAAECAVCRASGLIRYEAEDLPLGVVAAVTTSRIARRLGMASVLTARAVRAAAESGAALASLGMFDQGFYNRLGFGVGPYLNTLQFDPSTLALDHVPYRPPVRLGPDDAEEWLELARRRHRSHGGVFVDSVDMLRSELEWASNLVALGYRNAEGRLTHALSGSAKGEHGPYRIHTLAYEEPPQVLELLRLLKELGDQVHTIRLDEPPEVQLQDLIERPFHQARRSAGSAHPSGNDAEAWVQHRILDLGRVVGARSWAGSEVRCVIELHDPVTEVLARSGDGEDGLSRWSGIGGRYLLVVGAPSSVETVEQDVGDGLPVLRASVGAFTRCWLGSRSASSLALTDELAAPPGLLAELDEALRLPPPHPGWDY
jgi:hypothetical protein